ncbi:hypothetical protein LTS10_010887 [Elasticomyces elasticus]|nr:hypothetical protein LTS10_010887 [Elasticomyces elasticus]
MAEHEVLDALVVGAGFSGILATYRLRELGLHFRTIDKASDIGGTWFWNTYPGAQSDTESHLYRFAFDQEDLKEYPWSHRYLRQPEIQAYLKHVVARHELGTYFQFDTEMLSAIWSDTERVWHVETTRGRFVSRYLITGLGLLTAQNLPIIPGADRFKGIIKHTASWDPSLDLRGKRVGVIGNGSTGTQLLTSLAPIVSELVSFQRNPQYSVPAGNKLVTPAERQAINDDYPRIWAEAFQSSTAFGFMESSRSVMSVEPEERERIFEDLWEKGNGFRFLFSEFGDIAIDPEANEECCKFIRKKIRQIVKDPVKAAILQPTDPYAKRPVCDNGYYEIFNQDNVKLVDLKKAPLTEITETGIVTGDGRLHELDLICYATGFDAIDGSYTRLDIRGVGGQTIQEHWDGKASSYLGVATAGFPNLFMIFGPQSPFSNNPPLIESEVDFICNAIMHNESRRPTAGLPVMSLRVEAERGWEELCYEAAKDSLFTIHGSWITGNNVAGKKSGTRFFFGGLGTWRRLAQEEVDAGFPSFVRSSAAASAPRL